MKKEDRDIIQEKVMLSVTWLAGHCDHAVLRDGKGFSAIDELVGHALADKAKKAGVWTTQELLQGLRLVQYYKKQLEKCTVTIEEDISNIIKKLEKEVGPKKKRLKKKDVVDGRIWVEQKRIYIKTTYKKDLVDSMRVLVGRNYNVETKTTDCDLCLQNANYLLDISGEYGLKIDKSEMAGLKSTLSVKVEDGKVVVSGVNAGTIIYNTPWLYGDPEIDEAEFRAIKFVDDKTVFFPLNSWIAKRLLLWLDEEDHSLCRKCFLYVRDEIKQILSDEYKLLLEDEKRSYAYASTLKVSTEILERIKKNLPSSVYSRLMPHQWVAVDIMMNNNEIFLADQQGLGKTVEILAATEATKAYPAIIVAPATAILNWRDEINFWLPKRSTSVLGGRIAKKDRGVQLSEADFILVNYESFHNYYDDFLDLSPVTFVADEAQYLKGYKSQRSTTLRDFCSEIKLERIIMSTGTPVMNRPSELLTLMSFLPSTLFELGGFAYFAARYCGAKECSSSFNGQTWLDFTGSRNLGELANRLRETGKFIRRDKGQVLQDLRQKEYHYEEVKITNQAEYAKALSDFDDWLKNKNKTHSTNSKGKKKTEITEFLDWMGDHDSVSFSNDDAAHALRQITALRKLTGEGKIKAAINIIKQIVKEEKLVVFAYHTDIQKELITLALESNIETLSITAEMTPKKRRDSINKFQTDPGSRLIVCSIKAAQTAITLTAARKALFVEFDWTPAALEQAEDRIHRISQLRPVEITYLVAPQTQDHRMRELLESKRKIIRTVASGNAPLGYKNDGTPRKRRPGPGRPRLDPQTRMDRNRASKANWQKRNKDYMREYMQKRRLQEKIPRMMDALDFLDCCIIDDEGNRPKSLTSEQREDYSDEIKEAILAIKVLKKNNVSLGGLQYLINLLKN